MRGVEVDIRFAGATYVDVIARSDKETDALAIIEMLNKHLAKTEMLQDCEHSIHHITDQFDRDPGYNPTPMVVITKGFSCAREDFRKLLVTWTKELNGKFGKNLSIILPSK